MKVRYEYKNEITFIGFTKKVAMNEGFERCPQIWDEYNEAYANLFKTLIPEDPVENCILENRIGMYALCIGNEHTPDSFEYMIAGIYLGGYVPEGMKLYRCPASEWAVFSAKGPMPKALQEMNQQIWQEWMPGEGKKLKANEFLNIEAYSMGDMTSEDYESAIWIPIEGSDDEELEDVDASSIVSTMMVMGII